MNISVAMSNKISISWKQLVIPGILTIGITLALLHFNIIPVGSFFDDAHYLILAKSLATGQGYHLIYAPTPILEDAFPPGWPLLLTPLYLLAPNNFFLPRLLSFIFWFGTLLLAYRLFSRHLPSPYAEIFLALMAWNSELIGMAGTAMSESAYLFLSFLALNLLQRWHEAPSTRNYWRLTFLLIITIYTMLVRTIGITLVSTVLIFLLFSLKRRHQKYLLITIGILLLALIPVTWFNANNSGSFIFSPLYSQHVTYISSNIQSFLQFWTHVDVLAPENLANTLFPILDLQRVIDFLTPKVVQGISLSILATILLGYFLSLRRNLSQAVYFLFYAAIFYLWIVYINEVQPRIAVPLIPFFAFYLVLAVKKLTHWLMKGNDKKSQRLSFTFFALLLGITLARNIYEWQVPRRDLVIDLTIGTTWLKENAPPDAIVQTGNALVDYLYIQRKTVYYPNKDADHAQVIKENNIDYVLIHPLLEFSFEKVYELDPNGMALLSHLESNPSRYELKYRQPENNVWVFQVLNGR